MREVKGYVFIARFQMPNRHYIEHLFGPNKNGRGHNNLQINGLTLFRDKEIAGQQMRVYGIKMKRESPKLCQAYLWMNIADNLKEAERVFAKSRDLVVIASDHEQNGVGDILIGRYVKGKQSQYPLPGAEMILNGFATIPNLDRAKYIGSEEARQGQFNIKLARFKLKRIGKPIQTK